METTLYKKDKKGNILLWNIRVLSNDFHPMRKESATLRVQYGRLGGAIQEELIPIPKGKAGRSLEQQVELQFNSLVSKQKDKGYKSLEDLEYLTDVHDEGDYYHTSKKEKAIKYGSLEAFLQGELPVDSTDAQGRPKPMKCTALQDTKTNGLKENVFKKIQFPCIVQPKLDGVRCLIMFDEQNQDWIAISSSGKSYDVAAAFILENIRYCDLPKDLILDGELYIHGEPLEYLSGLARKQTYVDGHKDLQFHVFDVINKEEMGSRLLTLNREVKLKPLGNVKVVEWISAMDKNEIDEIYTLFTDKGYEGIIIRNIKGLYKQGVRSSEIFKYKDFQDAEFEIIGCELGKRGAEDMVFVLKTEQGQEFKAKPLGDRAQKFKFFDAFSSDLELGTKKIIGKKATVQFLTLSQNGIPQGNPRIKAFRDYE